MISYEPGSYVDFFFVWVVCCFLHLHVFTPNWDIWACLEMEYIIRFTPKWPINTFFSRQPHSMNYQPLKCWTRINLNKRNKPAIYQLF